MIEEKVKAFHIGFHLCGAHYVSQLFNANGYKSLNWAGGNIAQDIFFSEAANLKPLQRWSSDITLYTDMEFAEHISSPLMEAYKKFKYIYKYYPGSVFFLNLRDVQDWLIERFLFKNGEYAKLYSQHLNIPILDVIDHWERDWSNHIKACKSFFEHKDNFLMLDIDRLEFEDYKEKFGKWFTLKETIPGLPRRVVTEQQKKEYNHRINALSDTRFEYSDNTVHRWAKRLTKHAMPKIKYNSKIGFDAASSMYVEFSTTDGIVRNKHGKVVPIIKNDLGLYYGDSRLNKLYRTLGVINEISEINHPGIYRIDMEDSRLTGSSKELSIKEPIIAYCRRKQSENIFLWPLPEYHSLGSKHFPDTINNDDYLFEQKKDKVVWRGNLSGHCSDVLAGKFSHPTFQEINIIKDASLGSEKYVNAWVSLQQSIRFKVVRQLSDDKDFDLKFTLPDHFKSAFFKEGLDHFNDTRRGKEFFFEYKYILSLRGYDTGSNFLDAVNSNSVVLKEEDGWELFYTSLFKPWVHYIPLAPGAVDIKLKLEWARTNQKKCLKISENAKKICKILANPVIRKNHLEKVVRAYLSATKQFVR